MEITIPFIILFAISIIIVILYAQQNERLTRYANIGTIVNTVVVVILFLPQIYDLLGQNYFFNQEEKKIYNQFERNLDKLYKISFFQDKDYVTYLLNNNLDDMYRHQDESIVKIEDSYYELIQHIKDISLKTDIHNDYMDYFNKCQNVMQRGKTYIKNDNYKNFSPSTFREYLQKQPERRSLLNLRNLIIKKVYNALFKKS